jgi:transglutaminase-like putative cysteine protease
MTRRLTLALLLLVGLQAMALPDYSQGTLDVAKVMAEAARVTQEKFPNSDDVLVDDYIVHEYEPDGRAISYDETFFKVLTEKGRRGATTLTRDFTLPYSTASYTMVEVIKPDGRRVPVDLEAMSKVMVDRSQMRSNIYNPNSKVLQVTVPEVGINDTIHYVAKHEILKPRVPNTWSEYEIWEYTSPIRHFVYEIRAPKALPLKNIALKDEIPGTVTATKQEDGDRIVYRWEINNVPRMYNEPNMPPLYTVVQRLLVSTIPDWQYVSRWYWKLSEPHFAVSPDMKAKVAELTKGVTDREEKIRAIFRFVSQEIRYMGITVEKEAPGYEPHDAAGTFEQRHGVCRDKAALLVAMLRAAGFEAFPVLIHNGPKKDKEVPQPFFNHAISAVRNDDGTYQLMDSTDENTKRLFPAYLCNQSYLVATPEGDPLRTSPIIPATENLMHVATKASIDADGTLAGSSELQFDGINDNAYRGYFSRIRPEDRRRLFESVVKRVVAGAKLTQLSIKPDNMMDTTQPLAVTLSFTAENAMVSDGTTTMLSIPRLGTSVGMVNFILRGASLKERKYPFVTDLACGVQETLSLAVAPELGKPVALPEYPLIDTRTLLWKQELASTATGLEGASEFLIRAVEFSPEEYLGLKEALRTLEVNARKKPILVRSDSTPGPEVAADTRILDDELVYDITDGRNWTLTRTIRKEILTYKGKKDSGEIKLDYNPAMGEVKLLRASVANGEKVQTISEQEINVMDQGWVASAPRYPAGKTLVASLPGVEIGSIVEYSYRQTYRDRPFVAGRTSFRDQDPVARRVVRVKAPRSLPLETGQLHADNLGFSKSREGDRVVYEWGATNQPAVKQENHLPPWWSFNPTVFFSSGDWRRYAKEIGAELERGTDTADQANATTDQLCNELPDTRAKVIAIRDFVVKSIRDAGPGLNELPLSAITKADTVLADGYGNTSDRAVLLYAMLRRAGVKPEFVLASWTPQVKELREQILAYPAAYLFPSVLVRVKVDGEYVLLNDTDQYDPLGSFAHEDRAGLLLRRGRVQVLTPDDALRSRTETEYDLQIDAEGNAVIRQTTRFYGGDHGARRKFYDELPPEERRRHYQELLSGISQGAEPVGDLVTDFASYPGTVTFTARVPSYAVRDGQYLYFTLPGTLGNLFGLRADERTNAFYLASPMDVRHVARIHLPPGFRAPLLAPEQLDARIPGGLGTVSVQRTKGDDGNTIVFTHTAEAHAGIIPAVDYPELFELNRRLGESSARTVLLQTTAADE